MAQTEAVRYDGRVERGRATFMDTTALAVIDAMYSAVRLGDVEAAMAFCRDDIEIVKHHDNADVPFGGGYRGHAAAKRVLTILMREWIYDRLETEVRSVDGDVVRIWCDASLVHAPSRTPLHCNFHHTWTILDGRVARFETRFDTQMFASFIKYIDMPSLTRP